MASKGKKSPRDLAIEGLTRISRHRPHPNDLWNSILTAQDSLLLGRNPETVGALTRFYLEHERTTEIPDATFALIISTAVEQVLELAISNHFPVESAVAEKMFDDNANGPLGTFSAKIKIGHALGIYTKGFREELDVMRHIRNAFAHSWEKLDFSSPAIIMGCSALRVPRIAPSSFEEIVSGPKGQFLFSARTMYVYLEWPGWSVPTPFEKHPQQNFLRTLEDAK